MVCLQELTIYVSGECLGVAHGGSWGLMGHAWGMRLVIGLPGPKRWGSIATVTIYLPSHRHPLRLEHPKDGYTTITWRFSSFEVTDCNFFDFYILQLEFPVRNNVGMKRTLSKWLVQRETTQGHRVEVTRFAL